MMSSLFDRVADLVDEIGVDKTAAAKEAMDDPGGAEGPTSHPSKKPDENEQDSVEGEQSADNERMIRESIPDNVDEKPEATEGNAPKATDVQQGQGVDEAKPTGEDPSTEEDYKGKLEGDKREGDQGGTSHPAKGDYGEKYSADKVAALDTETLLKSAADLGNELTADIANGHFEAAPAQPAPQSDANVAAQAGEKTAAEAGDMGDNLDAYASGVVQSIVKNAYDQADLAAEVIYGRMEHLKQAAEGDMEDPTGGAEEGEDYEDDPANPTGEPPVGEEEVPGGAEELLAAMGGGGPEEELGGELGGVPGMEGGGEELPPEMMGMGGEEMGMPGMEEAGPPPELGAMGDEEALQQLVMALQEAGLGEEEMAGAGPEGMKIASAVKDHKQSGRFYFEEAKQGSDQRKVRDYMKGFVLELYRRSQR